MIINGVGTSCTIIIVYLYYRYSYRKLHVFLRIPLSSYVLPRTPLYINIQIQIPDILAPEYICKLITVRERSTYSLRSNIGILLQPPNTVTKKTLGDRAFSAAAPSLWNNLPLDIRNEVNFNKFKSLLKTHFFRAAFNL